MKNNAISKCLVVGVLFVFVSVNFFSAVSSTILTQKNGYDFQIYGSYSRDAEHEKNLKNLGILNEEDDICNQEKLADVSINKRFFNDEPVNSYQNVSDDVEVLSVYYDEDIQILEDGRAEMTSSIKVPPSKLCDMYRDTYGAPIDTVIGESIEIPEDVTIREGHDGEVMSVGRNAFYKSVIWEQWCALGIQTQVSSSRMIPKGYHNEFQIDVEGTALVQVYNLTDDIWSIGFGIGQINEMSESTQFLMSIIGFGKLMMQSIPGEQVFTRKWTTRIHLPEEASLIELQSAGGKSWLVDFGQGTHISAYVTSINESTILVDEVLVVTEVEGLNPASLGGYKSFTIDYKLPGSSLMAEKLSIGRGGKGPIDFEIGLDFRLLEIEYTDLGFTDGFSITLDHLDFTIDSYTYISSKRTWINLSMEANLEVSIQLAFHGEVEFSPEKFTLWNQLFPPINIPAGPIVIVLVPEVSLSLGIGFDAADEIVTIRTTFHMMSWVKIGAKYDWYDGWSSIWENDFNCYAEEPILEGPDLSLTVKPALTFTAGVKVYGIVGPQVSVSLYLKVTFGATIDPPELSWSLILGICIEVGVAIGIPPFEISWGFSIADWPLWDLTSNDHLPGGPPPEFDQEPPETEVILYTPPNLKIEGYWWTGSYILCSFKATDFGFCPSGVNNTYYCLRDEPGEPAPEEWNKYIPGKIWYIGTFSGGGVGYIPQYLWYYSDDNTSEPRVESPKCTSITADYWPPESLVQPHGEIYAYETPVEILADDSKAGFSGTGCNITFRIGYIPDGGSEYMMSDWMVTKGGLARFYFTHPGSNKVEFFSTDGVWNKEDNHSEIFDVLPSQLEDTYPYSLFSNVDGQPNELPIIPSDPSWENRTANFSLDATRTYRYAVGQFISYHPSASHNVYIRFYNSYTKAWYTADVQGIAAGDLSPHIFSCLLPSGFSANAFMVFSDCPGEDADLQVYGSLYFNSVPPYQPSNPSPANGAVGISHTQDLTVSWTGGDPDPRDNVTYDLYFGSNPHNIPQIAWNLEEPSYIIESGQLSADTTYLWYIISEDAFGQNTTGSLWRFTTGDPPDEIWVDDNASPGWYDETHLNNIQEALDKVDEGGTVHVWTGWYSQIDPYYVSKSLTLKGNGSSFSRIGGSIQVNADYVNINGFEITKNPGSYTFFGIYIASSHCNISDNLITDFDEAGDIGIYLISVTDNIVWQNTFVNNYVGVKLIGHHMVILDNIIRDGEDSGVELSGYEYNIISDNTIQNYDYGIKLEDSKHNNLSWNVIQSCHDTAIDLTGESSHNMIYHNLIGGNTEVGISIGSLDNTIKKNTINAQQVGIDTFYGSILLENEVSNAEYGVKVKSSCHLEKNTIINNAQYGLYLGYDCRDVVILDNHIYDNRQYGIYLTYCRNITISYNKLFDPYASNDQVYGIYLWHSNHNNLNNNSGANMYDYFLEYSSANEISDNIGTITLWSYCHYNSLTQNMAINEEDSSGIHISGFSCFNKIAENNLIYGNKYGIYIDNAYYTNITDNIIGLEPAPNVYGIFLDSGENTYISDHNEIYHNKYGIYLKYPTRNSIISENNFDYNDYGLYTWGSRYNNLVIDNWFGEYNDHALVVGSSADDPIIEDNTFYQDLLLNSSINITVVNNSFYNAGLCIRGNEVEFWNSHIITNNYANTHPILYYNDTTNETIYAKYLGQVILANCHNMTIHNFSRTEIDEITEAPIQLGFSSNNTIKDNVINQSKTYGIFLEYSTNNEIFNNTIDLYNFSEFYEIHKNTGICLIHSQTNLITMNFITAHDSDEHDLFAEGISLLDTSTGNNLTYNHIITSADGIGINVTNSNSNTLIANTIVPITIRFGIGMLLTNAYYNIISENQIVDLGNGISLISSALQNINRNILINDGTGITLTISHYNTIAPENEISGAETAISLDNSNYNTIDSNLIYDNNLGIYLHHSSNYNTVTKNDLMNNGIGIQIGYIQTDPAINNKIYHNNFDFSPPIDYSYGDNAWDNGYPCGGNYWWNYGGSDSFSGPEQNIPGSDGIGDTPYTIPNNEQDRYPYMNQDGWLLKYALAEALDIYTLWWTSGGYAPWRVDSSVFYHDGDAAQSGQITHNQYSWMKTTLIGPGTLKFYWKVSSEPSYDWLRFFIDDFEQTKISGNVDWHQMNYTILAGSHEIKWNYTKDYSYDVGSDCGWVDLVEWVPDNPPYAPSNPTPSHGATDVNISRNLSWTGGDPDIGDTVTYDVYFGTIRSPQKVVSNQSTTTYDPGTLAYGSTYFWKIVAWDNKGASTEGWVWVFTTELPQKLSASLNPTDDTFVDEIYPSGIHGSEPQLVVRRGGTGYRLDTLVKFDCSSIPKGSTITSAKLYLYYSHYADGNPQGKTLRIHHITQDWDENTTNWNNRPNHDPAVIDSIVMPSTAARWLSWNLTIDVQNFIDGLNNNYGWKIIDPSTSGYFSMIYFRSKEYSNPMYHPYLQINFTSPTPLTEWPMFRRLPNHTGYINELGPATNTPIWSYGSIGDIRSSPAVANNLLAIGSDNGRVYALNATTGAELWYYNTGGYVHSAPAIMNNLVYVGSYSDKVYALYANNGSIKWTYNTGGNVQSSPTVINGVVYIGSYDNKVYGLDAATGSKIWEYDTGSWVRSSPAVAYGMVYIGAYNGNVYALDAENGSVNWIYQTTPEADIFSSPTVANGIVYIGSADGKLYALDAVDGTSLWNYSTGQWVYSSPAVRNRIVYVGSNNGKLYALNATTGNEIWNYDTDNWIRSSSAVTDRYVYFGCKNNKIYCLNATDGNKIWDYTTGDDIDWSSPAVANGIMYIGSLDGYVYAFKTSNLPPYTPSDPMPLNRSFTVNLTPILSWTGGDPDGDPVTYDVYFGTVNPPPKVVDNQTSTSYVSDPLNYCTRYYWQIIAWDNQSTSTAGPLWTFSTKDEYIPMAFWHFDEDLGSIANDSTPYQNNGVITGATWTTGFSGSGLYFGGVSENYVNVPHSSSLDITGPFIIGAWINATGPGSSFAIVDKQKHQGTIDNGFSLIISDGKLHFSIYSGSFGYADAIGTSNLLDNTWHYVQGKWNNSRIQVYVDGQFQGETIWTYPPASTTQSLGIGKRLSGYGGFMPFHGKIDEVRISRNHQPNTPSNPIPETGAFEVNITTELSWISDDPDPGDAVTHDIYFGSTYPPPKAVNNQSNTTYDPGVLGYATIYYWKIVAWDNHHASTEGPIWIFTTEEHPNNPPFPPNNPDPYDGEIGVETDRNLSWIGGDPDPGDNVTYDVYFGNTTSPPKVAWNQTETMYDPGILEYETKYYWQIEAWDNHNASTEGPIWNFTTEEEQGVNVLLEGYCNYTNMSSVNNLSVEIINLNLSQDWQASIDDNYYYLELIPEEEINAGDILRLIAEDNKSNINVTDYIVTENDIGTGTIHIDLILDEFYLNLANFPMYEAESPYNEMCGPAVAQMTLNYIWWNSSNHSQPPMKFDDQTWLYDRGRENNSNTSLSYLDTRGLWYIIQYNKPMPYQEFGYNFMKYSNEDLNEVLKRICLWINYTVGTVGGHKEGHPLHVPAVAPAYGGYTNWMAIRGFHANSTAHPMPDEITIYGFWVNDPYPSSIGGLGENSYKMLATWVNDYYQPLVTNDTYDGKYVAILEPPEINENAVLTIAEPIPRFTPEQQDELEFIRLNKGLISEDLIWRSNQWIIQAAIEGVAQELLPYDDDFESAFKTTIAGTPMFVESTNGNDYYAVPFNVLMKKSGSLDLGKKVISEDNTIIVVLIDAEDGSFKEASWIKDPVKYLPVSEEDAQKIMYELLEEMGYEPEEIDTINMELIHRDSTLYYPEWKITIEELGLEFFIKQDGTIY